MAKRMRNPYHQFGRALNTAYEMIQEMVVNETDVKRPSAVEKADLKKMRRIRAYLSKAMTLADKL